MINYGKIKKMYFGMPKPVRKALSVFTRFIPVQYMYGKRFRKFYKKSLETEHYTREQIEERQNKLLRKLIKHSYDNVPYYTKLFKKLNLKPRDIKTKEDLKKLPILTKEDIRNNFSKLTARNYKDFMPDLAHTTGSTAKKLHLYLDQQNREKEFALAYRQLRMFGIGFNAKTANFRGDFAPMIGHKYKKTHEYFPLRKELIFSSYDMTEKKIDEYIKELKKFKPELIKGFPSALYIISQHILKKNLDVPQAKVIMTSSEILNDEYRETIERAFKTKVFDWYGASEYVISAGQCENLKGYMFNEDFGIVEILDEKNNPVHPGESGRIIGTGLYNYSMPLLRYDLEDVARLSEKKCSCKRNFLHAERIEGRVQDIIYLSENKKLPSVGIMTFWKKNVLPQTNPIEFTQVIQKDMKRFEIKVMVKDPSAKKNVVEVIDKELRKIIGNDAKIDFTFIDDFPSKEKWRFTKNEMMQHA
ncbi:MAG: phenylacetate--CoA ligase family protein [Candidatus Woesearchaeota archaeon]